MLNLFANIYKLSTFYFIHLIVGFNRINCNLEDNNIDFLNRIRIFLDVLIKHFFLFFFLLLLLLRCYSTTEYSLRFQCESAAALCGLWLPHTSRYSCNFYGKRL